MSAARSLLTGAPLLLAPECARVLVLAPHPDDETIGCGGTLALAATFRAEVSVIVATDGAATVVPGVAASEVAARRRRETGDACAALGLASPTFLDWADGCLAEEHASLSQQIAEQVAGAAWDAIFVPWPFDGHPDHRALARATAAGLRAAEAADSVRIWMYEVWGALIPNRLVDITAVVDAKRRALTMHATAASSFGLDAHLALNRWRSIHAMHGRGYAEAFTVSSPTEFAQLCAI